MSTVRINDIISVDAYLEGQLVSQVKHEYIAGAVFAMVGAKNAHNMIAINALLAFNASGLSQLKMGFSPIAAF